MTRGVSASAGGLPHGTGDRAVAMESFPALPVGGRTGEDRAP
jgi:hypothetical protein